MPLELDQVRIRTLTDLHDRRGFCCAYRGIQNFCRGERIADQNRDRTIRAYVATVIGSDDVIGFYYLMATSLEHEQLGRNGNGEDVVYLERIPAVYLGMIGVHEPMMRQGLGTAMMAHAFKRAIEMTDVVGAWAMTLDAIDDDAVAFYERFDFRRFSDGNREMFLPIATMRAAFESADEG